MLGLDETEISVNRDGLDPVGPASRLKVSKFTDLASKSDSFSEEPVSLSFFRNRLLDRHGVIRTKFHDALIGLVPSLNVKIQV